MGHTNGVRERLQSFMAKIPIPATSPLQSRRPLKEQYKALIALPCCNELASLPQTLHSLEATASQLYDDTLIIVNVNQRASLERRENLETLEWLATVRDAFAIGVVRPRFRRRRLPGEIWGGARSAPSLYQRDDVGRQRGALNQSRRRQSRPSGLSTGYFFLLA